MKNITLTESALRKIVKESVRKILSESTRFEAGLSDDEVNEGCLREAKDPTAKMQALIQAANKAVMDAKSACENNEPLMDRDGELYGLSGEIRLDGRGFIIFPYTQSGCYGRSYSSPERFKVLSKKGGVITVVNGDSFDPGWRDAQRELKRIIADAKRGVEDFMGYDPNWEDSNSPEEFKANKKSLRDFNKKIGARADRGSEYLNKNY